MEEFVFKPFKIIDKRINLKDHNINSYNLLEFLLLSCTPKKIANIFNDFIHKKIIKIKEDQEYEIEAILDECIDEKGKSYLIKWKNWHIEFSTWEPFSNIKNCKEEFKLYEERKSLNQKGLAKKDYLQPKMELIRQIMSVITECNVKSEHVITYLSVPKQNVPLKREFIDPIGNKNKRSKNAIKTYTEALTEWELLINETYPLFNVKVQNKVDSEGPPLDFQFIKDYVSDDGVEILTDPPVGCHCTSKCSANKEDCSFQHACDTPYTATGKIKVPTGQAVFECNSACLCPMTCLYRVVQNGVKLDLIIFRTKNRGWGLKTINKISKGCFIMEYLGEIITADEAEIRGRKYDQQNLTYLFDLDFAADADFTIDAYKKGNLSHFINHSCNPNMTSRCVYINNLDHRMPRIAFFAEREIKALEELTFDYQMTGVITNDDKENKWSTNNSNNRGSSLSDVASTSASSTIASVRNDGGSENASVSNSVQNTGRVKCLCKSANCRKYLF